MIQIVVLTAEIACALWFLAFCTMLNSMYLDSRQLPLPRLDKAGRLLLTNARAAFTVGLIALAGLAVWEFGLV